MPLKRSADELAVVDHIRQSFGDDIARVAEELLQENQDEDLSLLDLVTVAEKRYFEQTVGTAEQLANQRTNSRFEMID